MMAEKKVSTVGATKIKLGVTLYSFSNEWVTQRPTLESLVAQVSEQQIGPGVEIVGFQSIRTFPEVDPEFVLSWRRLLDKYGLFGSCLGSNIDVALRRDRLLTADEMVDYLSRQINSAHALGFPVLRIQMGATSEVIERVTPLAEKTGVQLGMEIHAPEGGRTAEVDRVRAAYDRIDSEFLGFIPDFSSTMHDLPRGQVDLCREEGVPEQLIARLREIWSEHGGPQARYQAWATEARAAGLDEQLIGGLQIAFSMFGHETIESWSAISDRIVHVHGKFYDIDSSGAEPSIDYPRLMAMLVDADYDGFISTEWEGHAFHGLGEVDPFALVAAQQRLETGSILDAERLRAQ